MKSKAFSTDATEFMTLEGCYIQEWSNSSEDGEVSISRARVRPGVTTARHILRSTDERYLVTQGTGLVEIGADFKANVSPGSVAWIPRDTAQRITNTGTNDLILFCVCTPRFTQQCYESLE